MVEVSIPLSLFPGCSRVREQKIPAENANRCLPVHRKRVSHIISISHPTRPRGIVSQTYATTTAVFRDLSYPSILYFSHPLFEWLSPPSLGQSLAILTYWIIITLFSTAGSIIHDAYYWERVGFRAAWLSVTQVPLIYLLAGKVNVLGIVLGSSYMDLNWFHRWVSRTLLITASIHGGFFITEWVRADFFQAELAMMPMVKWGMAAWGILAWTTISSLFPLRRFCYELFVVQHLASTTIFLWVLHRHVPSYAAYNVWMAVAFVLSGRLLRSCMFAYQNMSRFGLGSVAELEAMPGDITRLTIRDVEVSWKPGQHMLLWCPTLGPFETHPFTIANIPQGDRSGKPSQMELIVRARSGFTRRLCQRAASTRHTGPRSTRAFTTGPLGNLPIWNTFETLVLISASTGASFTLPILESILNDPCCVSRIDCVFLVRQKSHIDAYLPRLIAAASHIRATEIKLKIVIATTGQKHEVYGEDDTTIELGSLSSSSTSSEGASNALLPIQESNPSRRSSANGMNSTHRAHNEKDPENITIHPATSSQNIPLHYISGRPNLAHTIREPIEASSGETSVVVCGGKSLTSTVRNCVAGLSDERAVHKGTGAQGIHLHVEGFGS